MESELSPDKEKNIPPVPLPTYQWEDLRRAREAGGYPWTHLIKPQLEGEITAEDIIRATTPIRSMSREFSRSRTQSPDIRGSQRILNLNSSPGSSRRHNDEGQDEGVHVPNFSKEISLDSEDDLMKKNKEKQDVQASYLVSPTEKPKSVSPKSILKRRVPEQQYIGVTETREKTKCCHPLVNKIKHLADKTLQKLDRADTEKSPTTKRKKEEEVQEIRQLRNSPSAVKRKKFSAIKLGSSDEMSKTMSIETPPLRMRKDHIYEDIEEPKDVETTDLQDALQKEDTKSYSNKENDSLSEKKSMTSQDPSLITDDNNSLKNNEHIMEKLHIMKDVVNKEAVLLDEEMDQEEPNVDEVFQNQVDDRAPLDSPNITITEIPDDDDNTNHLEQSTTIPIETSPSPSPREHERKRHEVEFIDQDWSKPSSDHEYEVIEKLPPNIIYTAPSIDDQTPISKTDDELSSTTSLERRCLQHTTDDEDRIETKGVIGEKNENILNAEALQKDIEDRFFVNTPSTMSRTECEVSTSQVDSSALENLPLKRENRHKNGESLDSKIQQRFREGTGKLKTQAGKLRTKLNNLKAKQFSSPERTKINSQEQNEARKKERPKLSFPERPKFTLPDRRKFSLPDRPKFKKINLSEKLTFGDKKKFTMPERPKFSIPDLPKFKMPEKSKQIFSSLGRKKNKPDLALSESSSELNTVASVEFEAKTYPRLFNKKKKTQMTKTSSSPTLNREDTPPPVFTFTRMKKTSENTPKYIPDSPEHPREYGAIDRENSFENDLEERKQFETTYDFDKVDPDYLEKENEEPNFKNNTRNASSISDISPSIQEYNTHINEINNDEFFVRPRGISHENIQVREYLSDEIRQAFNIPKNVLASMDSSGTENQKMYVAEDDADPELTIEDNEHMRYSTEDLNDRDDGYYTFPPIRPSRAKRKKKEMESLKYMDESVNASLQFSEVDLGVSEDNLKEIQNTNFCEDSKPTHETEFRPDLHSIHEYANDDIIEYPDNIPIQSQTLPMPPKRKKKYNKNEIRHSYSNDFNTFPSPNIWQGEQQSEDIIVYRTEHEYIVPHSEAAFTEQSPVPPRRSRSRSSKGTSICDDDRTSHGAESLTLDTHLPQDFDDKPARQESPGYATVDKGPTGYKQTFRSKSKTPPVRRRKSNSSERKYYTVSGTKNGAPNRPPRKKSSSSLMTLDSFNKSAIMNGDSQYDEIEEPKFDEVHKVLQSGSVVNKMKDRPLPPPPRPPRGPKRKKDANENMDEYTKDSLKDPEIAEIEVSTQTDPLPDDVDFELGIDDHLDISMSSSLRDIIDEESIIGKASKPTSPHISRPSSRSEKSLKLSDPKMAELSKSHIGRTSPTVILVEKRVSSPTRINERDVILTEASLTVQPIDIEESKIPEVPPLPKQRSSMRPSQSSRELMPQETERALEKVSDTGRDIQLDNLVTQRLQVRDLDVGRLNVSELQASKILVSEIEGMTLNVNEFDSKTGNISVNGLELSQSVIDEIVKKFAEISTSQGRPTLIPQSADVPRPVSREEETQTEPTAETALDDRAEIRPPSPIPVLSDASLPPQRPPPPDLTPLLLSYLQDMAPAPIQATRPSRERPITEFFESQFPTPHPPTRRSKRKLPVPHTESSSEEEKPRPSPRRMPPTKANEPTITEAGAQFLRVCQNSISRTLRNIFNTFMSYISRAEDKKDVQMAMVIFLVLIAGLIMLGLSDSRTIHHHHWEFFNPPDTNK